METRGGTKPVPASRAFPILEGRGLSYRNATEVSLQVQGQTATITVSIITMQIPAFIKHLLCARPGIKYWIYIVMRSSLQPCEMGSTDIPISQRRKLRSGEVPKDTKASSEQEAEVLRAGFWKKRTTQGTDF